MQALMTHPPGGWEHTRLEEVEAPAGGEDKVLVEIRCAGINPADDFQVQGKYPGGPKPPFIAGRDASGVVIRGDAAGKWKQGDRVLVIQHAQTDLANGTFCQRQAVSAESLAPIPQGWSYAEAAAAPLVYQTAWRAMVDVGGLQAGMSVLVTGASGGVGSAAVQLAHRLGVKVVALSRSQEKRDRLRKLGADHTFAPDDPELKKRVPEAIGAKGVDLVVENIGGESLADSVHLLAPGGKVCVVGLLAGVMGSVPIPSLLFKQASIEGVLVSGYTADEAHSAWRKIVETLQKHDDRPLVDGCYPAQEYERAFARLRESPFGKVVLQFSDGA